MDNFIVIDKNSLHAEIKNTLKEKSSQDLSINDVKSLKARVEMSQEIKKHILDYNNNVSLSNIDTYLYDLLGIVSKILHLHGREVNNLSSTYNLFFKYSIPIIMDFYNTKGLKNAKKHIKKFNKLLTTEMLNIESIYEEEIREFIKTRNL